MNGPEAYRMSKQMDAKRAVAAVKTARDNGCPTLAGYMLGLLAAGQVNAALALEKTAVEELEKALARG